MIYKFWFWNILQSTKLLYLYKEALVAFIQNSKLQVWQKVIWKNPIDCYETVLTFTILPISLPTVLWHINL